MNSITEMQKLTESWGFQKLSEVVAEHPESGSVNDSIAGIIKEQLAHKYFDMHAPALVEAFRNLGDNADLLKQRTKDIPWSMWDPKYGKIAEYMASSGTTGIAGAYYLQPIKLYGELQRSEQVTDIVGQINKRVLSPEECSPGLQTKIDVLSDETMKVYTSRSGAATPSGQLVTVQCTLDFTDLYGISFQVAGDLQEDANWNVLGIAVEEAGKEIGEKSTDLALAIMKSAPDGDGNLNINAATGDAAETKFQGATSDVVDCVKANLDDGYLSDTMVTTHEAMLHSIMSTVGIASNVSTIWDEWAHGTWPTRMAGMDVLYADTDTMTTNKAMTACVTLIFRKASAMITGRKRWLRIENYSDPVKDLTGAVCTFRQDSVTLYKDSIAYMYET